MRGMFVPYDDYIDLDSSLWEDVKDANDSMVWDDGHYMAIVEVTGDYCVVIYNRKTIDEYGLDDPADLFAEGEWTWDAFEEMLSEYVDTSEERYGIYRRAIYWHGGRETRQQPAQRGDRGLPGLDVRIVAVGLHRVGRWRLRLVITRLLYW
ncbi:MAG: extracellular solute-binding protein [Ruminococcus sp.]|nr:extracellular solute-binding protein [Ruminococcus sp.]